MPIMNGYESSRYLRSLGFTGSIIAVTAMADKNEKNKCAKSGMDFFLTKPVCKRDVREILEKLFKI